MNISHYGVSLPIWRLRASIIAQAFGERGGDSQRAVAGHDQDSTTLAVDASRAATPSTIRTSIESLIFATTAPPYADKTNATAIHAALLLEAETPAFDMVGSCRSSLGALMSALRSGQQTLVAFGDVRSGLPDSADEREGGDAGAAIVVNGDLPIAEVLSMSSRTTEALERWRVPGEAASQTWEDRFGVQTLVPLGSGALSDALGQAGVAAGDVDHLIVCGPHRRACATVARASGVDPSRIADDLVDRIGFTGCAHPALVLASVLDLAPAGATIALVSITDGADAIVLRTTEHLPRGYRAVGQASCSVEAQITAGATDVAYGTFLSWRGQIRRDPPRRPDPAPPAAPPAARHRTWKYGFVGSRCGSCAEVHLPPVRVCARCGSTDAMTAEPMADVAATVATFTTDHLAASQNPPVVVAVLDFDGGGRYQCELTDSAPDSVTIGSRVDMTFRRMHTAAGRHNYFWKGRTRAEEAR